MNLNLSLILLMIKTNQCATRYLCTLLVHFEISESLTMEITQIQNFAFNFLVGRVIFFLSFSLLFINISMGIYIRTIKFDSTVDPPKSSLIIKTKRIGNYGSLEAVKHRAIQLEDSQHRMKWISNILECSSIEIFNTADKHFQVDMYYKAKGGIIHTERTILAYTS